MSDHEHIDSTTLKRWTCQCGQISVLVPDNHIVLGETLHKNSETGEYDFHVEPPDQCKLLEGADPSPIYDPDP